MPPYNTLPKCQGECVLFLGYRCSLGSQGLDALGLPSFLVARNGGHSRESLQGPWKSRYQKPQVTTIRIQPTSWSSSCECWGCKCVMMHTAREPMLQTFPAPASSRRVCLPACREKKGGREREVLSSKNFVTQLWGNSTQCNFTIRMAFSPNSPSAIFCSLEGWGVVSRAGASKRLELS